MTGTKQPTPATLPTHLIMVSNAQTQELKAVSACSSDYEASTVFAQLVSLFRGTPNVVHQVPLPDKAGFVDTVIISSSPPAVPTEGQVVSKPAPCTVQEAPPLFRRISQRDFALETQAMMEQGEGEWRDADTPVSEGGAFS